LNKVGPYREIFPEVLELSRNRFWCDYGYHIAPMTTAQLDEIDWLVDQGVASFKFYMFYKGLTLSADSTAGKQYAMSDEYDLGHAYELMVRIAEAAAKRTTRISGFSPGFSGSLSSSTMIHVPDRRTTGRAFAR
jgi:dihydropyrimidinase/allantoinase